jgi:hypothetical protein
MNETLTLHIEKADGTIGWRYQVAATGKVIAMSRMDQTLHEVANDLVVIGFTKKWVWDDELTIQSIDYTIDDLFDHGLTVLATFPIVKSFGSVYAVNMAVKHIEPSYIGKHRKEGTPA